MIASLRRNFVCVDFSMSRLTALEVSGRSVVRWADEQLSSEELRYGDPIDPHRLGRYLKGALERNGIHARRVRIAISDEATVTRMAELPRMPRRHLTAAMSYLMERELPFPAGKARSAWDVVGQREGSISVCMAAAWNDVVERLVEVVTHAGLEPEVVEPRSLAMRRALDLDRAVVLDAGPHEVNLTFLFDAQPPYTDQATCSRDAGERMRSVHWILDRAYRSHPELTHVPILVAGELESADLHLSMATTQVSAVLNGHPPRRPATLATGKFLSNLGLAMR